jgi:hypothetical protein
MAKTRSIPEVAMYPRLKEQLIIDSFRGQVRIRKWPRKRGKPKSPAQLASIRAFTEANRLAKLADASQFASAIKLVKNSGLYPRDVMVSAMLRGFLQIHLLDGRVINPWPRTIEDINVQSGRILKTTNQAITAGSTITISFQNPVIDDLGFYSPTHPTRLTIPNGVSRVEFIGDLLFSTTTSGNRGILIHKNGGTSIARVLGSWATNGSLSINSGPLSVTMGDYFELLAFSSVADTALAFDTSWFGYNVLKAP